MGEGTRSPIKDKPLRHPAQSLEEEWRDLWDDKIQTPLLVALTFAVTAALEWWRFYAKMPPSPVPFSLAAAGAVSLAVWRVWRLKPRMKALRQGIQGEKAVGQFLERLRADGYQVFHDIVGPGFNVDHVLIGRAGVFTIETKTWSKPAKGDARITFANGRLRAGNHEPDRDPLTQARAQATWLRNVLAESTGKQFSVMPVIAFPGWFVEQPTQRLPDIWVLEPKALPAFLEQEPLRLAPPDVKLAGFHLSRFIRSAERERGL